MARKALRALWLLVAVPLLASPVAAATLAYECGMSGTIEAAPCCDDHGPAELSADDGVESRPCCTLVEQRSLSADERQPSLSYEAPGFVLSAPPATTAAVFSPPLAPAATAAPLALQDPPDRSGPPLFVQHCSYLL